MGMFTIKCERCLALTKSRAQKDRGRELRITPENLAYRVQQAKLNRMPAPKVEEWWLCGECVTKLKRWLYNNETRVDEPGGGGAGGAAGGDG